MQFDVVDGELWRVVRGKKAGVTPARPERREFVTRDPDHIRQLLALCEKSAAASTVPRSRSTAESKSQPKPPILDELPVSSPARKAAKALPYWPRVLGVTWAAAYLSLSPTTFRATVGQEVPPIQLTPGRIGWDRYELDAWVDAKSGAGWNVPNPWHRAR